jgi:endonuclease/exonuclease/phosphatase (EEP) superfamily protein YafD
MQSPPGTPASTRRLTRLLLVALTGVALASLAGALAPFGWPFELFVHFPVQYGVAAAFLVLGLLLLRRPIAAGFAAAIAVVQLLPGAFRLQAEAAVGAHCGGESFSVVTANLYYRNDDRRSFVAWLAEHPADLVVVQELTPDWAAALDGLTGYPHRLRLTRTDPYGIAVMSRWPLHDMEARDLGGDGLPSLVGYVGAPNARLHLAALHAHWPLLPHLMRSRDAVFAAVADDVRTEPLPSIVAGDLNLTPHSPVYRRLLAASGLVDTRAAGRWQPTWRAGFWPLALRIDHVLVSPELCAETAEVGPAVGSDHRPVRVRLRLPAAG